VASCDELREAAGRLGSYFARGAFSRGGICCLASAGPLAGWLDMGEVRPAPASPWLVQPFAEGETACTCSTARGGRVSSRLMDRIPRQRKHGTGIQFEAVDAARSLRLIEPIAAEPGYTGQVSFGFLVAGDGLTLVECNPRAADGLLLMPGEGLAAGLLAPRAGTFVLEPGGRVQLGLAVLAGGFADHLDRLPGAIGGLAQVRDAGSGWHGPLPALYPALAMCHSAGQGFRQHTGQMVVMAGDVNGDGEPIEGMSRDDATLLTSLRPQPGGSS
jgi:hypothetical protein